MSAVDGPGPSDPRLLDGRTSSERQLPETRNSSERRRPEANNARRATRKRVGKRVWKRLLYLKFLLLQRHRYGRLVLEWVDGRPFLVLPQVFNPGLFASGRLLARVLQHREDLLTPGARVLDLGTGSGIGAISAAGKAGSVVATDINPQAVRCARINVILNGVEQQVEVRPGDLFAPLAPEERFDVVLFNPPYYRGAPRDALDQAWRSPDVLERFACQLPDVLARGGYALVVLSSDGEQAAFVQAFEARGLRVDVVAGQDLLNETLTVYRVRRA
jgi:release factor glutamine methyltransferase